MESAVNQNINKVVLCDKEDITLVKHDNNKYTISLNSINKNINFRNIINFNLYTIMGSVNKKHIKSAEMIHQISDNEATFLFLFNPLGADFGIPKKYMYTYNFCLGNIRLPILYIIKQHFYFIEINNKIIKK